MRVGTVTLLVLAVTTGCRATRDNKPDSGPPPDSAAPDTLAIGQDSSGFPDTQASPGSRPDAARLPDLSPDTVAIIKYDAAFVPAPPEPLVVNSGNTAKYDLAPWTWKVFAFEVLADKLYCVGGLGKDVDGYLGPSPSVSPSEFSDRSDSNGALFFTPYASGTRYIAIATTDASASGSFQISDGGELLIIGTDNPFSLTAPTGDDYHFFHFTVAPGHDYTVSVTGDTRQPVVLGLSPKSDRSTEGQFAFPFSSKTSVLPIIDEPIPYTSTIESATRYYFIFLRIQEPTNVNITITLAS